MSKISIVIPVFNEEENIASLYERLVALGDTLFPDELEIIFVDDCSTDRSFYMMLGIATKDKRIKILRFSKNFGSHMACYAGIIHSSGDSCGFIAADLQDPPELFTVLIEKWREGSDAVFGVRDRDREASFFEKITSRVATYLMKKYALKNIPERNTDVFLIDKKVVDVIRSIKEKNVSIFGLILWLGFKQIEVPYKKERRKAGRSKWTLSKKIKILLDTFVSFSYFPIRLMSVMGIVVALLGFFYAMIIILNKLFFLRPIEGWASIMVVLLGASGIQMLMLGILGEYLWRNYDESRSRPAFIIADKIGFREQESLLTGLNQE